jgi:ABC-type lipoprotein release transport system permease subunit
LIFVDTFRNLRLFLLHICIVAGICLPILILLGINRGQIADMRHTLETNPTGRQVSIWTAQTGPIFDDQMIEEWEQTLTGLDIIIPDIEARVSASSNDGKNEIDGILTLQSTKPNDPKLAQHGVDVLKVGEMGVVLSQPAARELRVQVGAQVVLTLARSGGGKAPLKFDVKGIFPADNNLGYVDKDILDRIQLYLRGHDVREWELAASETLNADDTYGSYLLFCKKTDDLKEGDKKILRETYQVDPVDDKEMRTLLGLLNEKSLVDLSVYRLQSGSSLRDFESRINVDPSHIAKKTVCDEVIIPWNTPRQMNVGGQTILVVGCTIEDPCWLRRYLVNRDHVFSYFDEEDELQDEFAIRFPQESKLLENDKISVRLNDEVSVNLTVEKNEEQKAPLVPGEDGDKESKPDPAEDPAETDKGDEGDKESKPDPAEDPAETDKGDEGDKESKPDPPEDPAETDKVDEGDKESKPDSPKDPAETDKGEEGNKESKPDSLKDPAETDKGEEGDKESKPDSPKDPAETDKVDEGEKESKPESKADGETTGQERPILAVVPGRLLAHLGAFDHHSIQFDQAGYKFVPVPDRGQYEIARTYAKTIDDVPGLLAEFVKLKFSHQSQAARISEIKETTSDLEVLVFTVGLIVAVFGLGTIATVLWDSTNRKRKDIGILRIMGVSGPAVLYMVVLRAAIIGTFATILTFGVAWSACEFLAWQANPDLLPGTQGGILTTFLEWKTSANLTANAFLDVKEDWIVACIALGCSLVGSIAPGIMVSRLDPFDAVVHSKDT